MEVRISLPLTKMYAAKNTASYRLIFIGMAENSPGMPGNNKKFSFNFNFLNVVIILDCFS